MSLWQIAYRNIWQNRGRYVAYLASSAFSVMIYFLYSALIYHPQMQSGYRGAGFVVEGMKGAAVVIAVFTFLFLLYSASAFVRSRMKEFGLLTLLGVSRTQLVWIILCESFVIALVAMATGLGFGLLFLKLFFMAISVLLRLPEQIPVYAGLKVWTHTLSVFGGFFLVVSLASLLSVLRKNIIELVRAGRQPKGAPTFSRAKAMIGLLLVAGGYVWASFPSPVVVIMGIVPVTAMVCVGTYLLMREGSIAFLTWLHKRERFFYRPGPFLNVSQLVYKMQDNYRVLSAVGLLVAVILTAVGTATTLYLLVTRDTMALFPHALQTAQVAGADPRKLTDDVQATLKRYGATGLTHQELVTRRTRLNGDGSEVTLVPYSFYESSRRLGGETLVLEHDRQAVLIWPTTAAPGFGATGGTTNYQVLDLTLEVKDDDSGRVLNRGASFDHTLVVADPVFAAIMKETPAAEQVHFGIWDGRGWRSRETRQAVDELRTRYPLTETVRVTATVEVYQESMSTMGIVLFIGGFVSLVFFAACFSLLYFRLFTEIDEDRKYFKRLEQVGVSSRELKRLALRQAGVIFFVPFLTGLIHSTFAMVALGQITGYTVIQYGWAVACGYLVLYGVCFGATATFYWRSLRAGLTERLAA